jgi:hypothetical protein
VFFFDEAWQGVQLSLRITGCQSSWQQQTQNIGSNRASAMEGAFFHRPGTIPCPRCHSHLHFRRSVRRNPGSGRGQKLFQDRYVDLYFSASSLRPLQIDNSTANPPLLTLQTETNLSPDWPLAAWRPKAIAAGPSNGG